MKTQKIEELLAEYPGRNVEIWFSLTRRHDPKHNDFISTARGDIAFVPVRDVNIKDLRAYEAVEYDEAGFAHEVADIGGMKWEEYADEDGTVTVFWLSYKSYRILTDPDIRQVSAILPKLYRQYSEFIAVRLLCVRDRREEIDWDEDFQYDKDDLEIFEPQVRAEIIPLTKCNLDLFWAEAYYFVREKDIKNLPFHWSGDKSFEKHFSHTNVKILVAVCI